MSGMSDLIAPAVNFAILAGGIFYFVKQPTVQFVKERHLTFKKDLEEVQGQLKDAQAKYTEYDRKLSALDQEVKELYQDLQKEMETTKITLITNARKAAEGIVTDARATSESLVEEFKQQLRNDVSKQVLARAETHLRSRLTGDERARIVKDFSKQVEAQS